MRGHAGPLEQLRRSGRGDVDAFAELYDRLAPRVFGAGHQCLLPDASASEASPAKPSSRRGAARRPTTSPTRAPRPGRSSSPTGRRYEPVASRRALWAGLHQATSMDDSALLAAGLTHAQSDAVQLAWFHGLDHRRIEEELDSDKPVTTLINEALRLLAPIGPRL